MINSKKRKQKVLSKYESYPSKITNIRGTKSYKIKNAGNGVGGSHVPKNQSAFQPIAVEDKIYEYEFYFNCDMRRIIDFDISQIRFSIVTATSMKTSPFFSNISRKTPRNIIASTIGQRKDNRKKRSNDVKKKLIRRGAISLSREISNLDVKNAKSLTDSQLFGTAIKTKIVKIKNLERKGDFEKSLSQIIFQTVDHDKKQSGSPRDFYHKLINHNIDPSSAFKVIRNSTSPDPRRVIDPKRRFIKYGVQAIDRDINSMRGAFENIRYSSKFTISKGGLNNTVAVPIEVPNRVRTIVKKLKLRESQLKGISDFLVKLTIINPKTKLEQEVMYIKIDHKLNVENYYIPTKIPKIKTMVKSNGTKLVRAGCQTIRGKKFEGISGMCFFTRIIVDDSPLLLNPYRYVSKLPLRALNLEKDPFKKMGITVQDYYKVQTRACPILLTGNELSNFSHDSERGRMFNHTNCTIFTQMTSENSVKVSVYNMTENIVGISVYKKLINSSDKFKVVNSEFQNVDENDVDASTVNDTFSVISHNVSGKNRVSILDMAARPGKTYVYRAMMYLDDGTSQMSRDASMISASKPINVGKLSLDNIDIDRDASQGPEISFDIKFEQNISSTNDVIAAIKNSGLESLFEEDEASISSTLSDMCLFGVMRFNKTTGDEVFLGYFSSGSFTDGKDSVKPPSLTMNYEYRTGLYFFSPDDVKRYISAGTSDNLNIAKDTTALIAPSTFTKMRSTLSVTEINKSSSETSEEKIALFQESKLYKNINKAALTTGMISDTSSINQTYPIDGYYTGMYASVRARLRSPSEFKISSNRLNAITLSRNGSPVLRFSILSTDKGAFRYIDMVVIKCRRQGDISICGVCNAGTSNEFIFADYLNRDYVGLISYTASIVLLDGTTLPDKDIGQTILGNRRPAEKRIKRRRIR